MILGIKNTQRLAETRKPASVKGPEEKLGSKVVIKYGVVDVYAQPKLIHKS